MMWHFKKKTNDMVSDDQGYTLLELLVVLVILVLIVGIAGPQVLKQLDTAKNRTAQIGVSRLLTDVEFFKVDTGRFPTAEEGLSALTSQPADVAGWAGPYVSAQSSLEDPWGNPYVYTISGDQPTITSYGADGASGGTDDISGTGN